MIEEITNVDEIIPYVRNEKIPHISINILDLFFIVLYYIVLYCILYCCYIVILYIVLYCFYCIDKKIYLIINVCSFRSYKSTSTTHTKKGNHDRFCVYL